ncbi:RNA polymerase sigma-70 factor [Parabacteroides sp. W1-Q-101]|uniref:RNA polymerase sigma factor n=1 Tax=Parabacteroides TaxID=375288 RepID=UPI00202EAB01|nr:MULTISPECIES: RNA polymerase sigma-70 factor [Parabacteroides]MCM0719789.1 RNA polymerase sigma-70 factor [Parabacteroides sp. W1-Q-101]
MKKGDTNIQAILEDLATKSSEPAFKSLYFSYSDRIMRYLVMYVKSSQIAEELVSDVFFALWENRKQLVEITNFDAYIYRIAKFRVLKYLRDNKTLTVDLDEVPIELFAFTETTPEDDYISRELIDALNEAIEQLPTKSKLAFKLVREDGMKYKDAAEHLGISVKTLEAQLTYAMKKIAKIFNID